MKCPPSTAPPPYTSTKIITKPTPKQNAEAREQGELQLIDRVGAALTALDGPLTLAENSPFRALVEERGRGAGGEGPKKVGLGLLCGGRLALASRMRTYTRTHMLLVGWFACSDPRRSTPA